MNKKKYKQKCIFGMFFFWFSRSDPLCIWNWKFEWKKVDEKNARKQWKDKLNISALFSLECHFECLHHSLNDLWDDNSLKWRWKNRNLNELQKKVREDCVRIVRHADFDISRPLPHCDLLFMWRICFFVLAVTNCWSLL